MRKRYLQFETELLNSGTGFGGKTKNVTISSPVETLRATSLYNNSLSTSISILLNANSFFPKSLSDAPR